MVLSTPFPLDLCVLAQSNCPTTLPSTLPTPADPPRSIRRVALRLQRLPPPTSPPRHLSPAPDHGSPNALRPLCTICSTRHSLILLGTSSSQSCSSPATFHLVRARRSTAEAPSLDAHLQICHCRPPPDRRARRRYGFRTPCCVVLAAAIYTLAARSHPAHNPGRIAPHETELEDVVERVQASPKGPGNTW